MIANTNSHILVRTKQVRNLFYDRCDLLQYRTIEPPGISQCCEGYVKFRASVNVFEQRPRPLPHIFFILEFLLRVNVYLSDDSFGRSDVAQCLREPIVNGEI